MIFSAKCSDRRKTLSKRRTDRRTAINLHNKIHTNKRLFQRNSVIAKRNGFTSEQEKIALNVRRLFYSCFRVQPNTTKTYVHTSRNERKMDRPLTFDRPSSIKLRKTITTSKQFHLSLR